MGMDEGSSIEEYMWERIFSENDEVYIYGAANTARKFLKFARDTHVIDKIKGLVVSNLINNASKVDGYDVTDIHELENKRAAILVPHAGLYKQEIAKILKELEFANIYFVHNIFYYIMMREQNKEEVYDECMVNAKERMQLIQNAKSNAEKYEDKEFRHYLEQIRNAGKPDFGHTVFYQSLETIGLEGTRPSLYRIIKYDLETFLEKNQTVLDIGCNSGFLDMMIADKVQSILGIEYDETLCDIANSTKKYLDLKNCQFVNQEFDTWYTNNCNCYDVIFSFAIHHWLNLSVDEYAQRIDSLLNSNGYVCMESHMANADPAYDKILKYWTSKGYTIVKQGQIKDDGVELRNFCILQKQ